MTVVLSPVVVSEPDPINVAAAMVDEKTNGVDLQGISELLKEWSRATRWSCEIVRLMP